MINKQRIAIILGCVVAVFLLTFIVKVNIQKQVLIKASLYDISMQYTDLRNWQYWYPSLNVVKSTIQYSGRTNAANATISWDNHIILTTAYNPAAIVLKETIRGKNVYQSVNGFPADNGNSTIITWTKKSNVWQWIKEKLFSAGEMSHGLINLKALCENSVDGYGFDIQVEPVKDTIIATQEKTVAKNEILKNQLLLFESLQSFLQQEKIEVYKNYIFISSMPVGKEDSMAVAVGIPVRKKGSDTNEIQFLELPSNGRLLVGNYTGQYGSVNKLYDAMDRYVKEKGLKPVAQRMEEHIHFSSLQNDSTRLTLRLIYPIY